MNKQFWLSCFLRFLIYFCHWLVLAHIPVVFLGYGLTNIQIGSLIGLFSLSSMILMIPMGIFSDLFSPRKILLMGGVSLFCYYTSLSFVTTFLPLLLLMVVGGFGAAALIVVSEALFLKRYGQKDQNRRISYYQGFTYLGFGLGPLCGGILLDRFSTLFLFGCAVCGISLLIMCCLYIEDSSVIRFSLHQYRVDLSDKRSLLLIASVVVVGLHFGVEQVSTALLMKEDIGLNSREIGQIFCILGLWMGCMVLILARIKERGQALFLFLLGGMAFSGIFQAVTAWATSYWSFAVIRGLHTLGDCLVLLEMSVLIALLFPSSRLGGSSGFLYGVRTLAAFSSAVLSGMLNQYYGYHVTFILSGVFMVGFSVTGMVWIFSSKKRRIALHWS